jgi:hypothetical protein
MPQNGVLSGPSVLPSRGKRTLYNIKVRRMANGCDYNFKLWLCDPTDAFLAAAWRIRIIDDVPRNELRLISVDAVVS